jgi:UDP-N-acetylglucosamine diphosphorylase / glucose-1-phosphate thymidylyltransferase / UDP-N-acetylgalactosamine diphosphorylase / glucosamine-1-phosphate N-acetyltransferase / galactosamine-1-phosphate N-acetyltransferase
MKAVILVAGKGTRMKPLTETMPKPLIPVCSLPLITHILSRLPQKIDSVVLVIGYKGEQIKDYCGNFHKGKKIHYVVQEEIKGTAHALFQAKDFLKEESFLLLYGDDIVDTQSIENAMKYKSCILAFTHPDPRSFGVIMQKKDGTLAHIIEKPEKPESNLVSASGMILHTDIFKYYGNWEEGKEWCIPTALERYAKENPVHIEHLKEWHPINSLEQLKDAEKFLC